MVIEYVCVVSIPRIAVQLKYEGVSNMAIKSAYMIALLWEMNYLFIDLPISWSKWRESFRVIVNHLLLLALILNEQGKQIPIRMEINFTLFLCFSNRQNQVLKAWLFHTYFLMDFSTILVLFLENIASYL